MPKLKIVHPGFETYTGFMGDTEFKDGVSIDTVSISESRRLACVLRVTDVDTGKNPSSTQEMVDQRNLTLNEMNALKSKRSAEESTRSNPESKSPKKATKKSKAKTAKNQATAPALDYSFTRESLGAIADETGLDGLREFANPYDVRGPSIRAVIESLIVRKDEAAKAKA